MVRVAIAITVACVTSACSTTPAAPSPHNAVGEPQRSAPAVEAPNSNAMGEPAAPTIEPTSAPATAKPSRGDVEVDINYDDCTVLAQTFERVWLRDAQEKNAKEESAATPSARETLEESTREAAATAGANWLKACARTVGSAMPRKNLVCASKAKTLERFNACYDGRAD